MPLRGGVAYLRQWPSREAQISSIMHEQARGRAGAHALADDPRRDTRVALNTRCTDQLLKRTVVNAHVDEQTDSAWVLGRANY